MAAFRNCATDAVLDDDWARRRIGPSPNFHNFNGVYLAAPDLNLDFRLEAP